MTRSGLEELQAAIAAAVEQEGLRPLSYRSGVPVSVIRSAVDGRNLTYNSLRLLSGILGWTVRIGPPAGAEESASGFAHAPKVFQFNEPAQSGWGVLDPLPGDSVFIVQPDFRVLDDLPAGTYCLVEPEAPLRIGDLVYIEDHRGCVNLGRYHGKSDRGWHHVLSHGGTMVSDWNPDHLRRIAPITWTGWTPPPFVTADTAPSPPRRDTARITARIEHLAKELDALKEEIAE